MENPSHAEAFISMENMDTVLWDKTTTSRYCTTEFHHDKLDIWKYLFGTNFVVATFKLPLCLGRHCMTTSLGPVGQHQLKFGNFDLKILESKLAVTVLIQGFIWQIWKHVLTLQ